LPQIDTPLLLDILLGLVILLFVPFGIRRGVAKEAIVSAGILLGANLADRFGATWGAELSSVFNLQQGTATFTASVALLAACTFSWAMVAARPLGDRDPAPRHDSRAGCLPRSTRHYCSPTSSAGSTRCCSKAPLSTTASSVRRC
jgi:hypothetical protein